MGTIFNVTNNGISDLHNVAQECDLIMVKSDDANEIGPNKTRPKDFMLGDLPLPERLKDPLSPKPLVRGFNGEAHIEIVITYDAPLWHRPGIKRFPVSVKASRRRNLGLESRHMSLTRPLTRDPSAPRQRVDSGRCGTSMIGNRQGKSPFPLDGYLSWMSRNLLDPSCDGPVFTPFSALPSALSSLRVSPA